MPDRSPSPPRHNRHWIAVLVTVCACGVLALAATGAVAGVPHAAKAKRSLTLVSRRPATVRGSGFPAHSRVRVTLLSAGSWVRRVRADGHGVFTVGFPAVVDRCTAWSVTAIQGGAAPLVVHGPAKAMCAPASTP